MRSRLAGPELAREAGGELPYKQLSRHFSAFVRNPSQLVAGLNAEGRGYHGLASRS